MWEPRSADERRSGRNGRGRLLFYAMLFFSAIFGNAVAATVVHFPDPNLEAVIREIIKKPTGDILQTDLVGTGLTNLSASARGISNLSGLEQCADLESISLFFNRISDITALAGLLNLQSLRLRGNQISDITALAGLLKLTSLDLSYNRISDITALAGLLKLTSLDLSYNRISDITALAGLLNLRFLYLDSNRYYPDSNQISDITALAGLNDLRSLYLDYNLISDITALAGLVNLRSLHLSGNRIADISAVANLNELRHLWLSSNMIVDANVVLGLGYLKGLSLAENRISSLNLAANLSFSYRDGIDVRGNPLDQTTLCVDLPILRNRGVFVWSDGDCAEGNAECANLPPDRTHSADVDRNWSISLVELMRVIQFYNSNGYSCDARSEDGYRPEPADCVSFGMHDSDYNPPDWRISLSELLRLVQYFNAQGYTLSPEPSEDGYTPMQTEMLLSRRISSVVQGWATVDVDVTLTLDYRGSVPITALGIEEFFPDGGEFLGFVGDTVPDAAQGHSDYLDAVWFNIPNFPIATTYRLRMWRAGNICLVIPGRILYRTDGEQLYSDAVTTPLVVGESIP